MYLTTIRNSTLPMKIISQIQGIVEILVRQVIKKSILTIKFSKGVTTNYPKVEMI